MSFLVARVVVAAPVDAWLPAAMRLGQLFSELPPSPVKRWRLAHRAIGSADDLTEILSGPPWPRVSALAQDPTTEWLQLSASTAPREPEPSVWLALPVRATFRPFFEPAEVSMKVLAGLPSVLSSERQPRVATFAASIVHTSDAIHADALLDIVREFVACARSPWAQAGIEEAPGAAWPPSNRNWVREVAPSIHRLAPDVAWWMALGAAHVAGLGGEAEAAAKLAKGQPKWIGSTASHRSFEVRAASAPVARGAPELAPLRTALAPILMAPPVDPSPCFLLVGTAARRELRAGSGISVRRLPDHTVEIDPGTSPAPRGDPSASAALAQRLEQVYGMIPDLAGLVSALPLYVPRLLGERSYLRIGKSHRKAGMPVWDSGEPLAGLVTLKLITQPRVAAARRRAIQASLVEWSALVGMEDAPPVEWGRGCADFSVPLEFARGESFLLLVLALDRSAGAASRADVHGLVIAPHISAAEVDRRWRNGEPPFTVPSPP